jgi:N-acetylmuramoyl-L-alanine amidase
VNGWQDIGYHYGIENVNGTLMVLPGRSIEKDGAHALGFNRNGIGICLVGNYDIEAPSPERLAILRKLVLGLMNTYRIPADNVIGHRETYIARGVKAEKTCPGSQFDMNKFRKSLSV